MQRASIYRLIIGFTSAFALLIGIGVLGYQQNAALVLIDVAMPGLSGIDVARQLKHEPHPPRIIVITISTDAAYAVAARQAGADGFLTKSACRTQLIPLIRSLFAAPT